MNNEALEVVEPPRKKHWIFFVIIFLIAVLVVAYIFFSRRNNQPDRGRSDNFSAGQGNNSSSVSDGNQSQADCKTKTIFTKDFTDLENISSVGPLGGLNVGSASRSYVTNKRAADGTAVYTPIYAPMDSTLMGIYYKKANYGNLGTRGEYRLEIDAGCGRITYVFDHIAEVNETIKNAGAKEPSEQSNDGTTVKIPLKAGDLLGRTDGTKVSGGWDFYLLNQNFNAFHINSDRWQSDHNTHADCPYNYFTPELKTKYEAKLALWDGQKPAGLTCGQVSHDVADTLSGGWFQGDATDIKGTKLLLGATANMVEVLREVSGALNQSENDRFGFRTYSYSKKPEDVKVGEKICYSGDNKYIYLNLVSSDKLQTARGSGNCPATFPTSGIEEWQR